MYKIHNAKLFNRVAALVLDLILVFIIFVVFDNLVTKNVANQLWQYDEKMAIYEQYQMDYGLAYKNEDGIIIFNEVDPAVLEAFNNNEEVQVVSAEITTLQLYQFAFDFLIAEFIVFFVLPLIFKNGQTLGKKMMRMGLMSADGNKVQTWQVFARFIIATYALETMVTIIVIFPVTPLLSAILMFATKKHTSLQDLIAGTRVVDLDKTILLDDASQRDDLQRNWEAEQNQIEEDRKKASQTAFDHQ